MKSRTIEAIERLGIASLVVMFALGVILTAAGAFTTTLKIKGEDGKVYRADIVAYVPVLDDEPKLLRIYDEELDAVGYILQNDMAEFLSGLVVKPLHEFDAEKAEKFRKKMRALRAFSELPVGGIPK